VRASMNVANGDDAILHFLSEDGEVLISRF
jgi:hypothetical protein